MGILDRFRAAPPSTSVALVETGASTPAQYEATIGLLTERFAELELQLEDFNWQRMVAEGHREFTRDGLDRIIALSRIMAIKNPLTKRAMKVVTSYVWGQGVEISARDEQVNELVQAMIGDKGNRRAFFGDQARKKAQRTLFTEGNLAVVLFPNRLTGNIAVRTIPIQQIREVIGNPEDRSEPWLYRRVWDELRMNPASGHLDLVRHREELYPDIDYRPRFRAPAIGSYPVNWDTPMMHVKVNDLDDMHFGVPETYASDDWSRAYKTALETVSSVGQALQRFVWEMTSKRGTAAKNAARLATTVDPGAGTTETNPSAVTASTFVHGEGTDMKPINKQGAMIEGSSFKEHRMMAGTGMGLPDTILSGDPDQGNLATAKTLDRPTELGMMDWQQLWVDVYRDLFDFLIDWSVRAPVGALSGQVTRTDPTTETVVLPDETDRTVDVTFPAILEEDVAEMTAGITAAQASGLVPPRTILTMFLDVLEVSDADEIVTQAEELGLLDGTAKVNAGDALIQRFRDGQDPAALLRGGTKPAAKPDAKPAPTPDPEGVPA